MNRDFSKIMAEHSNAKLIEITTKQRNDYQPEAILAAEEELKNRNLDEKDLIEANEEVLHQEKSAKEKSAEPLDSGLKVLFFLMPVTLLAIIFGAIIAGSYKNSGYDRKFKDTWKYMLRGIVFYASIFIVLMIILKIIF